MKLLGVLTLAALAFAEILEEDDILIVDDANLSEFMTTHPNILIEFYAPWCGHCKALAPEYAKAAARLKKNDPPIYIGKNDGDANKGFRQKVSIQGFPTLVYFEDAEPTPGPTGRTADEIVSWVLRKNGIYYTELKTKEEAQEFLENNKIAVLFHAKKDSAEFKNFKAIAEAFEHSFYAFVSNEGLASEYNIKKPGLSIIKQIDDIRVDFSGDLTSFKEVDTWMEKNQYPWLMPFDDGAIELIFVRTNPALMLFRAEGDPTHAVFEEAAPQVHSEIVLAYSDQTRDSQKRLGELLGIKEEDMPCMYVVEQGKDSGKKYRAQGDVTVENIKKVIADYKEGKLKPEYKSEPIPEEPYKLDVRVLVAENFEEVVYDKTKDVLVWFYAEWCELCKELRPEWSWTAEKLKETHPDFVMARIDATLNEIPAHPVSSFPTIKYFPANNKEGVEYEDGRLREEIWPWAKNNATTRVVEPEVPKEEEIKEEPQIIYTKQKKQEL